MAATSHIEWTDTTWNPVVGCLMVSPGCANCYAEIMAKRLKAMALADIAKGRDPGRKRHYIEAIGDNGKWSGKLIPVPDALEDPLGWKTPRMVFVNSMSDLFYGDDADRKRCEAKGIDFTPVPFEFIDKVFASIALADRHTAQILTKRPERMADYFDASRQEAGIGRDAYVEGEAQNLWHRRTGEDPSMWLAVHFPLPNVWLGTSVEDQKHADERIPHLVRCPAAVRFLSCEPLLGPLDLSRWLAIERDRNGAWRRKSKFHEEPLIGWVIVGGESGHGSRPCNIVWIRDIVAQCAAAGVPCFVKQLGARPELFEVFTADGIPLAGIFPGSIASFQPIVLRDSKGGDWNEWPADVRVRQFPAGART